MKAKDYLKNKPKKRGKVSRENVGIIPEQLDKIKKLVESGKYASINYFVISAVETKLDKEK